MPQYCYKKQSGTIGAIYTIYRDGKPLCSVEDAGTARLFCAAHETRDALRCAMGLLERAQPILHITTATPSRDAVQTGSQVAQPGTQTPAMAPSMNGDPEVLPEAEDARLANVRLASATEPANPAQGLATEISQNWNALAMPLNSDKRCPDDWKPNSETLSIEEVLKTAIRSAYDQP